MAIGVACDVCVKTAMATAKKLTLLPSCDSAWVATRA